MNQALYRKYRSKKLSEIVGQEHITATLSHALKQGRIAHAYLFTGPKGVGKTSIARILAHEINQLPYSDESTHLDIIEIDAASNRRIDEIRDLREKVHIAPTSAKYKVYIIDEVHMLTKEAFNALLKTLEEPPAHVVFILATTEAHKLPETIISRTQRFSFTTIEPQQVIDHLAEIAKKEGFTVDADALQLIAEHGDGSFRDSISLLDQVASGQPGHVTEADVRRATGSAPAELIAKMIAAVNAGDHAKLLELLQVGRSEGIGAKQLAHQLIAQLRTELITNGNSSNLSLMQKLLDIEHSTHPDIALELLLLRTAMPQASTPPTPSAAIPSPEVKATPSTKPEPQPEPEAESEPTAAPVQLIEPEAESEPAQAPTPTEQRPFSTETWTAVLAAVKSSNPSLYSVLRMADTRDDKDALSLHFKHKFHTTRLSEAKNQKIVADLLKTLTGESKKIQAIQDDAAQPTVGDKPIGPVTSLADSIEAEQEPVQDNAAVSAIMETFGGGEVVDT